MRPSRLHDSTLRHFYWSNADDIKRRSSASRKKWMRPTRATRFEQRPSVSYVSIRPLTAVVSHRAKVQLDGAQLRAGPPPPRQDRRKCSQNIRRSATVSEIITFDLSQTA